MQSSLMNAIEYIRRVKIEMKTNNKNINNPQFVSCSFRSENRTHTIDIDSCVYVREKRVEAVKYFAKR